METTSIIQETVSVQPPLLESLTPDSIPESDDYCPEKNSRSSCQVVAVEANRVQEEERDAFLKLEQENVAPLLPSPPPSQQEEKENVENRDSLLTKKRVLVNKNDNNNNKPPTLQSGEVPVLKEGCKWCQRCGTIETPRWRYGPGGPSSLCNACHLRWKTLGKPADGYSATTFPPPFYNVTPVRVKRKSKKNASGNNHVKRIKKNNIKSEPGEEEEASNKENLKIPSLSAPVPAVAVIEAKSKTPIQAAPPSTCCTMCHTTQTPLWRRGPLGFKTLCNACGLKWIKEDYPAATPIQQPSTTKKPITPSPTPKRNTNPKVPLLHQKKQYIKHGLYSIETRLVGNPHPPKTQFSFPLPIHYGEFLLTKEKEFELPPDIHQERELGLIKGLMADQQPFFTRIRSNIFVERKPQLKPDDQNICQCVVPSDKSQMGCGDDCLNRMLFYECDTKLCPCGSQCSNQRFQRKERTKGLQVFQTDTRGWGLRTLVDIKKGDLVIEYRGEIISHELCEERMCTIYVNEKNFYFLDYCNGEVIDACTKGTEARFINHSCDPNCHIEKWSLKGESHFGVFASQDIPAKSELFYDYNFSTFNGSVESQQICYCGSKSCRGTIGKKGAVSAYHLQQQQKK